MSLLLLVAALAAEPVPASGTWLGADTLAAPDGKVVFARAKGGGVEAIEVATEKVLWVNKDAGRPAGVSGDSVFTWVADEKKSHVFRIASIEAATGKTAFRSEAITMPEWASAGKAGGRSFRTAARSDGRKVIVVWQANAFYYGGAAPTPEVLKAARKDATEVASVDPKTGKVTVEGRKPGAEEFGAFGSKVGGVEFKLEEQTPGFKPGAASVTKVTLTATRDGKALWKRELAGNPWSPLPP